MLDHITVNNFENEDLEVFLNKFKRMEASEDVFAIPIYINSEGGDINNCLAMCDMIENSNKMVYTIAMGKAYSAAGILLAAGRPGCRYIYPSASVMLHNISVQNISGQLNEIKTEYDELNRINSLVYKKLDKWTNNPSGYFENLLSGNLNDLYFDAEKAKNTHIIDQIGMPNLVWTNTLEEL